MTKALKEISNFVEAEAPAPGLPDKPSEYLAVALADFKRAGQLQHLYRQDIGTYYQSADDGDGVCTVCLAGAAVAFTLGYGPDGDPYGDGPLGVHPEANKLDSISDVAFGYADRAYCIPALISVGDLYVPHWRDPAAWEVYVREVIETLREHGL